MYHKTHESSGFTLIEISVILISTGLLISGIIVGSVLIKAAELRSAISQKTNFDLAVNTFKLKYNDLAGDIPSSQASAYGLFTITGPTAGSPGHSDGNGMFGQAGDTFAEPLIFWRHLSEAHLIAGSYGSNALNPLNPTTGYPTLVEGDPSRFLPPSPLGAKAFLWPVSHQGRNYYWLTGINNITTGTSFSGTAYNALSPANLYALDSKMDDGLPASGGVLGFGSYNATPNSNSCLTGGAGVERRYNLETSLRSEDPGAYTMYNPMEYTSVPPTGPNNQKICFLFMQFAY